MSSTPPPPWEAEWWYGIRRRPPRDPRLLRRGGHRSSRFMVGMVPSAAAAALDVVPAPAQDALSPLPPRRDQHGDGTARLEMQAGVHPVGSRVGSCICLSTGLSLTLPYHISLPQLIFAASKCKDKLPFTSR
ncbi:hypothetical protein E2562_032025 [Oryza meyeriana var. granulata]|uniref:Uncharacterized protein n=1 Tax=Oryza meyeriana var. granulata TaxID=110450 RepID=A0A6G1FET4_9ORYZ|nr:hypothetical protein E2562_032025 [Oryza meyeriana var. granulata]